MKPATPLPWHTRGPARGLHLFIEAPKANGMPYALDVCGDDYTGYGDDPAREQNMRYIAHAANAYPNLVAALKGALGYVDYVANNGNESADRHAKNIREVLRSLGESE